MTFKIMTGTCKCCGETYTGGAAQRRFCETCKPHKRKKRQYTAEQRGANKEYLAKYHQDRKSDPAYKAKRKAESDRYHARRPVMRLLAAARARAKAMGLPYDLQPEDVPIPQFCPVLGIPLIRGEGARTDHSPSLDRLRPDRGYVRGNVYVISERANRLKNNGTANEHRLIAAWMDARQ